MENSDLHEIEAELNRLHQKQRTFCGGPEAEMLKLQIEALERVLVNRQHAPQNIVPDRRESK